MEIRWQEGFRFRFIFLLLLPVYCTVLDSDKPLSRNGNQVARGLPVPVYFPPSLPGILYCSRGLPVPVYFPPSLPVDCTVREGSSGSGLFSSLFSLYSILYCSRHVCLHMALCCSSVRLVNISGGRYFPVLVYYSEDFVNNAFSVKKKFPGQYT